MKTRRVKLFTRDMGAVNGTVRGLSLGMGPEEILVGFALMKRPLMLRPDRQSSQETIYSHPSFDSSDSERNESRLVNGIVSVSSHGPGIRMSASLARVIIPVSPIPPVVAAKYSEFSAGLQCKTSPLVRNRSSDRTWLQNDPRI